MWPREDPFQAGLASRAGHERHVPGGRRRQARHQQRGTRAAGQSVTVPSICRGTTIMPRRRMRNRTKRSALAWQSGPIFGHGRQRAGQARSPASQEVFLGTKADRAYPARRPTNIVVHALPKEPVRSHGPRQGVLAEQELEGGRGWIVLDPSARLQQTTATGAHGALRKRLDGSDRACGPGAPASERSKWIALLLAGQRIRQASPPRMPTVGTALHPMRGGERRRMQSSRRSGTDDEERTGGYASSAERRIARFQLRMLLVDWHHDGPCDRIFDDMRCTIVPPQDMVYVLD
mmetsp:Transcript_972/g.3747  ORF Transcript_972/g.3747 Transcript_972/m.3747 type:complete len:291 (-) Transcript_972:113-985(-)